MKYSCHEIPRKLKLICNINVSLTSNSKPSLSTFFFFLKGLSIFYPKLDLGNIFKYNYAIFKIQVFVSHKLEKLVPHIRNADVISTT